MIILNHEWEIQKLSWKSNPSRRVIIWKIIWSVSRGSRDLFRRVKFFGGKNAIDWARSWTLHSQVWNVHGNRIMTSCQRLRQRTLLLSMNRKKVVSENRKRGKNCVAHQKKMVECGLQFEIVKFVTIFLEDVVIFSHYINAHVFAFFLVILP